MRVEILQDNGWAHSFLVVIKGIWTYPIKADMEWIASDWGFIGEFSGNYEATVY